MADDSWINTYTGRKFYPLNPRVEDIDIEDIAHALSMQCRFTGHTADFYSVAQHCVAVAARVPEQHQLWGLLHDAAEAYLIDLARPVKNAPPMAGYRMAEKRLMTAVCERFGLEMPQPLDVTVADNRMLITEAKALMTIHPDWFASKAWQYEPYADWSGVTWSPDKAKCKFLTCFFALTEPIEHVRHGD